MNDQLHKKGLPVIIFLTQFRIEGEVHINHGERLTDLLVESSGFLPVTDAKIYSEGNRLMYEQDFISVNPRHVVMMMEARDKAMELAMERLRSYPNDVETRRSLARLYENKSLIAEAIKQYEMIIKINPKDVQSLVSYGDALAKHQQERKAIEIYKRVVQINRDKDVVAKLEKLRGY